MSVAYLCNIMGLCGIMQYLVNNGYWVVKMSVSDNPLGGPSPTKVVRDTICGTRDLSVCLRERINDLFTINNCFSKSVCHDSLYYVISSEEYPPLVSNQYLDCSELDCSERQSCVCHLCRCCSSCRAVCSCLWAVSDPDTGLQQLLLPTISAYYL